jgi:hypothetical protein
MSFRLKFVPVVFLIAGLILVLNSNIFLIAGEKSGIIRGSFVVDENKKTAESKNQKNQGTETQANEKGQDKDKTEKGLPFTENEKANKAGVEKGKITLDKKNAVSKPDAENKNKQSVNTKNEKTNKKAAKDDIDYKKIYFVIISALVLFLYLIFGMKRKGRRRHSGENANRYLK